MYILQCKLLIIARSLGVLWKQYRGDMLELIVERAVSTTLSLKQQGGTMLSTSQQWFAQLPRLVRWVLQYISTNIPFVEQIQESLEQIDREQEHDVQELQIQIVEQVHARIDEADLPLSDAFVRWLIVVNILVVCGVLIMITMV